MTMRLIVVTLLTCASMATPRWAVAAPEKARELVKSAMALKDRDPERALELMKRAHELDPQPRLLNNVGVLLEKLGRYREAYATYGQVLAMADTDDALRVKDEQRMAALKPKIALSWLLVVRPKTHRTFVDGAPWTPVDEGPLPPGWHEVQSSDRDGRVFHLQRVYAVAGRRKTATVVTTATTTLVAIVVECPTEVTGVQVDRRRLRLPIANGARILVKRAPSEVELACQGQPLYTTNVSGDLPEVTVRSPTMALPISAAAEAKTSSSRLPVWLVAGGGVIALGTAAVLWTSANGDRNELEGSLGADPMPASIPLAEAVALRSSYNTKANIGAVLLTAGIVALATSIVLYLTTDTDDREPTLSSSL